jgi:hypothetical protein
MPGTNYDPTDESGTLTYGAYFESNTNPQAVPDPQQTRIDWVMWLGLVVFLVELY